MKRIKFKAAAAAILLSCTLVACGEAGGGEGTDVAAEDDCDGKFEDGTRMAELADAGEITVGVKFDQPGMGFKDAASDIPTGLDVENESRRPLAPGRPHEYWPARHLATPGRHGHRSTAGASAAPTRRGRA